MKKAMVTTIYSPDDGGFYAEVSDWEGKEIGSTEVVESRERAKRHGYDVATKNGYTVAIYNEL